MARKDDMAEPELDIRDHREAGHFWADNEVLDVYGPQIGVYGFAVYMALTRFANNSGVARPSVETIAKRLNLSATKVRETLTKLRDVGLLHIQPNTRERDGRVSHFANHYVLLRVRKSDLPTSRGEVPTSRGEVGTSRGEVGTSRGEVLIKQDLKNNTSRKKLLNQTSLLDPAGSNGDKKKEEEEIKRILREVGLGDDL